MDTIVKIKERRYYPMIISEKGTEEKMSFEEDHVVWSKFDNLPTEKQTALLSYEMLQKIRNLQDTFRLSELAIGNISLFIRKLFFGELTPEGCEAKIGSMLLTTGGGDPNQARAIVESIQKEILTIQPKPKVEEVEEKEQTKKITVSLPLLQALSKYENLGNQLITAERIKVKSQAESVRPSLLYWLKYYRDELGIGQHNSIERGDFLFRSENCKKLSPKEREHVNFILKSIEENLPLSIDTEAQEIIFPAYIATQNMAGRPVQNAVSTASAGRPASSISGANNPAGVSRSDGPAHIPVPLNLPEEKSEISVKGGLHINPGIPSRPLERKIAENGGISFSAGHIFPAEKEVIEKRTGTMQEESYPQKSISVVPPSSFTSAFHPAPHARVSDDSNPFIIHPSRGEKED